MIIILKSVKNPNKILVKKITLDIFFENNNKTFNFIYIYWWLSWMLFHNERYWKFIKCFRKNGIIWMDDYCEDDCIKIKNTMDKFLEKYKDQSVLIHIGYQLAIKKI